MSKVFVVGAGTIGLRTALELMKRSSTSRGAIASIALRSPVHPLHTSICSMGAAGFWMPFASPDVRTDGWALETYSEYWNMLVQQQEQHEDQGDDAPLIEKLMAVILKREHSGPTLQEYIDESSISSSSNSSK